MFKNYITIAFRNLLRNKIFTIINISGLTIGMVSFILIMLYVNYESSYDRFFGNSDRIYRVYMDYFEEGNYQAGDAQTYLLSGPTLKNNFPEVEAFVRLYQLDQSSIVLNNNIQKIKHGLLADSSYFTVFGHPLIFGNVHDALAKPNSIVLTKSLNAKLFENENSIGSLLDLYENGYKVKLTVTGVMPDIPENTHIQTDYLISFATSQTWEVCPLDEVWNNNCYFTYLLLNKGIDSGELKNKLLGFNDEVEDERHNIEPITDIHLKSDKPYEADENGSAARVVFLFAMAIVIVFLSWLNFINLSISKSMERAMETGVRKASGASRLQLIMQFLLGSVLVNVLAIILSIGLVILILPIFNAFTEKDLTLGVLNNRFYMYLALSILAGALLSGVLPAMLLSNANPSIILKGKKHQNSTYVFAQKALVTFQIVATIVLLVLTIAINKQLHFIQNSALGFNCSQVIALNGDDFSGMDEETYRQSSLALKEVLSKVSGVQLVAMSQTYPGDGYMNMSCSIGFEGVDGEKFERGLFYMHRFDEGYIPLMNYKLLAGRNFDKHDKGKNVIIVNESMAHFLGYQEVENLIGKTMKVNGNVPIEIIGVLKDHHFFGFKTSEPSMLFAYDDFSDGGMLLKLNAKEQESITETLSQIKQAWHKVFKESDFSYAFIDEQFNQYYINEKLFNKAFSLFTLLAIFIASLGMFGLGTQICIQRTKEVGMRKINGANVFEVIAMLNKEFVQWVIIAFVLASPLAYYLVYKWLQSFAYRTSISWWFFALAGLLALLIAMAAVSWQTYKTARRNPVEALRYE